MELDRLVSETEVVAVGRQPRPENISDAMDVLYEIQDSLMFNEGDEE